MLEERQMSNHAPILDIRRDAMTLLEKLDQHELFEAAALLASTIDLLDASIQRLEASEATYGD